MAVKKTVLRFTGCLLFSISIASTADETTVLYEAVVEDDETTVGEFLLAGGSPNALIRQVEANQQPEHGWSGPILELALMAGRDAIAALLVEAGADTGEIAVGSPVLIATEKGMTKTLAQLLERDASELMHGDPEDSPLVLASAMGFYNVAELMLTYADGAGLHWGDRINLSLRHALAAGNEDIARRLLKAGASPLFDGVIHAAVLASNPGIVSDLLRAGAPAATLFEERSPLEYLAIRIDQTENQMGITYILEKLVRAGADVCTFAENADEMSQRVRNEFKRAVPVCDWSGGPARESAK